MWEEKTIISSGDATLDKLLSGGFHRNLTYLLYGDKRITTNILLATAVMAQKSFIYGGLGDNAKVAFIDGNNMFNPYTVNKFAVSQTLSPQKVLENILVTRAFTWGQLVELFENKLSQLEEIKVVLISGIPSLFQSFEEQAFEDLSRSIGEIKKILSKINPLIVLTAPLSEQSIFKHKSGSTMLQSGDVLALINDMEPYVEYILVQHPTLPKNRLLKWKPAKFKKKQSNPLKNSTLDRWFS